MLGFKFETNACKHCTNHAIPLWTQLQIGKKKKNVKSFVSQNHSQTCRCFTQKNEKMRRKRLKEIESSASSGNGEEKPKPYKKYFGCCNLPPTTTHRFQPTAQPFPSPCFSFHGLPRTASAASSPRSHPAWRRPASHPSRVLFLI